MSKLFAKMLVYKCLKNEARIDLLKLIILIRRVYMSRIVVVDSGRGFTKSFSSKGQRIFQSAISQLPGDDFRLTVKTNPEDLWVKFQEENFLIGDLAIRQRPGSATQDRDPNKTNNQNKLQVLTACSLHSSRVDNIVLLTNCPARDWKTQRLAIKKEFQGIYSLEHRAGNIRGEKREFEILDCYVLPEGETAYYGYCYDLNLRLIHSEVFNSNTLVLDIGDQTWNYISMNPGGEPYDEGSGSLDTGMHKTYSYLQSWFEQQGVQLTQAELISKVISNEPIMRGKNEIKYFDELNKYYQQMELDAYSQLSARLNLVRYQNIILSGGGPWSLKELLIKRYDKLVNVIFEPNAQFLNCYGAYILYHLSRG